VSAGVRKQRLLALRWRVVESLRSSTLARLLLGAARIVRGAARLAAGRRYDALEDWCSVGRVVRIAPRAIGRPGTLRYKISKFLLSARHVGREARRHVQVATFDVVIGWMPALPFAPVVGDAVRAGVAARLLLIGDFFPDHHSEIGLIPRGPLRWLAKLGEQAVLRRFTTIFCTLPANAEYLRQHYRLGGRQGVRVAPNWTTLETVGPVDRAEVRARHRLPADAPLAVFGGQITAGRGFDQMLDAADLADRLDSGLAFLFVGDGPLAESLAKQAAGRPNVFYLPSLPTARYRELLGACDVGLAATVPGVSSHTTPSKTLDYLKAAVPMVIAVEPGNEFAELFERRNVGRAVAFGDPEALQREATYLATDPDFRRGLPQRAHDCLAEIFDVRLAVSAILDAAGARHERKTSVRNPTLKAACVAK